MTEKQRKIQKKILTRLLDIDDCETNDCSTVGNEHHISWSTSGLSSDTGTITIYSNGSVKGYFPPDFFLDDLKRCPTNINLIQQYGKKVFNSTLAYVAKVELKDVSVQLKENDRNREV